MSFLWAYIANIVSGKNGFPILVVGEMELTDIWKFYMCQSSRVFLPLRGVLEINLFVKTFSDNRFEM